MAKVNMSEKVIAGLQNGWSHCCGCVGALLNGGRRRCCSCAGAVLGRRGRDAERCADAMLGQHGREAKELGRGRAKSSWGLESSRRPAMQGVGA